MLTYGFLSGGHGEREHRQFSRVLPVTAVAPKLLLLLEFIVAEPASAGHRPPLQTAPARLYDVFHFAPRRLRATFLL